MPESTNDELRKHISDVMADLMVDVSLKKLSKHDGGPIEKGRLYIESHNGRLNFIMQLIHQHTEQAYRLGLDDATNAADTVRVNHD